MKKLKELLNKVSDLQWLFIGLFISIILSTYVMTSVISSYLNKEDIAKKSIGKKVVINKDTLVITDYSMLMETYKLSNGTEISFEYLKK